MIKDDRGGAYFRLFSAKRNSQFPELSDNNSVVVEVKLYFIDHKNRNPVETFAILVYD